MAASWECFQHQPGPLVEEPYPPPPEPPSDGSPAVGVDLPLPPPCAVIDPKTESPPSPPTVSEPGPAECPPAPIVTVYDPGDVDTGNAEPANG